MPCRECGVEVSGSARTCPTCGATNPTKGAKKLSRGRRVLAATIAVAVATAGVIVVQFDGNDGNSPAGAYAACKDMVRHRLKSPTTAEFCSFADARTVLQGEAYRINGWVDAENSFGAKLRTQFSCLLYWDGSESTWKALAVRAE